MADRGQPIDNIFNIPAIKAQYETVVGYVDGLAEIMQRFQTANEKLGSSNTFAGINTSVKETTKILPELAAAQDRVLKSELELTKAVIALTDSLNKKAAANDKTKKTSDAQLSTEEKLAKSQLDQVKATQEQTKYQDALTKQREKEQKQALQATNLYLQLNKTLSEQRIAYTNAAIASGENSDAAQKALKVYSATRETLDKLDGNLRDYRRNVGNYKSAFDGLGLSFTQIARELPSLTISTQQFFLAISNNLPYAIEQIGLARQEIAAAQAAGEATQSLGSRIVGSLTSFNVIAAVSVTLLTAFGSKIISFVEGLFDSSVAADKAAKKQDDFNKSLSDTLTALDNLQQQRIKLGDAYAATQEQQVANLEAQGVSTGKLNIEEQKLADARKARLAKQLNDDAALALLSNAPKDRQANIKDFTDELKDRLGVLENYTNNARFLQEQLRNAEKDKDKEQFQKEIDTNQKLLDDATKKYNSILGIVNNYYSVVSAAAQAASKTQRDEIDAQKQSSDNLRKFNLENLKTRLEDRIAYEEQFSDAITLGALTEISETKKAASNRALLLKDEAASEIAQLQSDADFRIKNDQLTDNERKRLESETAAEIRNINTKLSIDLTRNAEKEREQIIKIKAEEKKRIEALVPAPPKSSSQDDSLEAVSAKRQALITALLQMEQEANASTVAARAVGFAQDKEALEKQYSDGALSYNQYQEKLSKITIQNQKNVLQDTKDDLEAQLEIYKKYGTIGSEAALKVQKALSDTQTEIDKLSDKIPKLGTNASKSLLDLQDTFQKISGYLSTAVELIGKAVDNSVTRQKNALQSLEDQQEINYENEQERIASSSLSDQQKQTALIELEAKRTVQKEANDRKERQIERQRAIFDKAANLSRIVIEGALAVLHQLTSGDPFTATARAIAVGAIAGIEFGIAASAPIPAFELGGTVKKDGVIQVAEKGYELIKNPNGSLSITPDKPTLMYAKAGTEIIRHDEVDKVLLGLMMKNTAQRFTSDKTNSVDLQRTNILLERISKKNTIYKPTFIMKDNRYWLDRVKN